MLYCTKRQPRYFTLKLKCYVNYRHYFSLRFQKAKREKKGEKKESRKTMAGVTAHQSSYLWMGNNRTEKSDELPFRIPFFKLDTEKGIFSSHDSR